MAAMSVRTLAAAAVLALVTGCASTQDDGARRTAQEFHDAISGKDAPAACAALALRTRSQLEKNEKSACEQAILREDIPKVGEPSDVEVFGTMAKVTYPHESTFLSRFSGGWRVVAAGCTPAAGQPYDCQIEGS